MRFVLGVTIGLAFGTAFFVFILDRVGAAIWPSYPGYPYVLYLAAVSLLGGGLIALIFSRAGRPFGIATGISVGVSGSLLLASLVLLWIIAHV